MKDSHNAENVASALETLRWIAANGSRRAVYAGEAKTLLKEREALRDLAQHLRHCRRCRENDVRNCKPELWERAMGEAP